MLFPRDFLDDEEEEEEEKEYYYGGYEEEDAYEEEEEEDEEKEIQEAIEAQRAIDESFQAMLKETKAIEGDLFADMTEEEIQKILHNDERLI